MDWISILVPVLLFGGLIWGILKAIDAFKTPDPNAGGIRRSDQRYPVQAAPAGDPGKLDIGGTWCPHCGHRNSQRETKNVGCFYVLLVFVSFGLALLAYPLLPREWHCLECRNRWRA